MSSVLVSNVLDYHLYTPVVAGEGKLLGYPSMDGKGVIASPGLSLSIVANSQYKDEAWEVIKAFFGEEAQVEMSEDETALPVLRSAFEKIGKETMERIDRVYQVYLENRDSLYYYGGEYFPCDPNLVGELTELIESVRYTNHQDEALMNILLEETGGYFSGSRSAEDVLKNVDNRAKQIVQEQ